MLYKFLRHSFFFTRLSALVLFFLMIAPQKIFSQGQNNLELAKQYESTGDFDKAAIYYEKQYAIDPFGTYDPYLKCLKSLKNYDKAEKLVKKQSKKTAAASKYTVDLGLLYELQGEQEKANKQFEAAIKNLLPDANDIYATANTFIQNKKPIMPYKLF